MLDWNPWQPIGRDGEKQHKTISIRTQCHPTLKSVRHVHKQVHATVPAAVIITEASHPDEVPYVGWLKTFAFLSQAERTNPDLGPSDWIYQSMSDGVLAQCAASNTSEWLLGWNKAQGKSKRQPLTDSRNNSRTAATHSAHWYEPSLKALHTLETAMIFLDYRLWKHRKRNIIHQCRTRRGNTHRSGR